jgi:hypothetical protein
MTRSTIRRLPLGLLTALSLASVGLAACHDAAKGVGAQSAESHAPGTTMAVVPGGCGAYPKGAPGVINTYCNGPAKVTVSIDGQPPHALTGGTCVLTTSGAFTLNLGVLATRELAGPRPDYVGLKAPIAQGAFDGGGLVVVLGKKIYVVNTNHGVVSPTGGSFAGTTRRGRKVVGSFTC